MSLKAKRPALNDHIFGELLGRGTYGTVYKAMRKSARNRQSVAIKCITKSMLSANGVDNLMNEISITKEVKHANIVELFDFRWDETYIYLIFEYCSGGELAKHIRRHKRLSEPVVQHFVQQIAAALKVLREHNIVHMDLKPQNILLSCPPDQSWRNVMLKIADFGFSQYLRTEVYAKGLRGSPLYMAPEILLGQHYDSKIDLWSVGVIMYECLFGSPPFVSDTFTQLADKIKNGEPIVIPSNINLSSNCRDLLMQLLERDPKKRINFDHFFCHSFIDLEHIPTRESYAKGVHLIQQAVDNDIKGDYLEAFESYSKGLQYLVPVYNWADESIFDSKTKLNILKSRLIEYMDRAEDIKKKLNIIVLEDNDLISMRNAFEYVRQADVLMENKDMKRALDKYNNAIDIAISLIPKLKGKERLNFYNQVNQWINKAESIKLITKECENTKTNDILRNNDDYRITGSKLSDNVTPITLNNFKSNFFNLKDLSPTCYVQ